MPRFFFDVRDEKGLHRDEIGDEFTNFEEARAQAKYILPDLRCGELTDGGLQSVSCKVRDESGHIIYETTLTYEGRWIRQEAN